MKTRKEQWELFFLKTFNEVLKLKIELPELSDDIYQTTCQEIIDNEFEKLRLKLKS